MIFNRSLYFIILLVSVITFFGVPKHARRLSLILSGIIFYSSFAGSYIFLVLAELLLVFSLIHHTRVYKITLAALFCIGILAVFKYSAFSLQVAREISAFINTGLDLPAGKFAMPLAISFFTFEFLHVIIDRHQGKIKDLTITNLAAFIFFFPSLVAGPIKRFQQFIPQIDQAVLTPVNIASGSFRILVGLCKKLVLADTLAVIRGNLLTTQQDVLNMSVAGGWIALFCFAWQIYFDFSGYSDIAIGSARLFGINLPENFNRPYFQSSISAFWRSWHATLTRWITDYIYIPLGGSRKKLLTTCANSLVAMAVSGIWHGATSNYFLWGVYHGLLLSIERIFKRFLPVNKLPKLLMPIAQGFSVLITFLFVSLGWLLFIAPLGVAQRAFVKMIGVVP